MSGDVIQRAAEVLAARRGSEIPWDEDLAAAQDLADAGPLPTETEWGVRHSHGRYRARSERDAREHAAGSIARDATRQPAYRGLVHIQSRNVTPWKDADA